MKVIINGSARELAEGACVSDAVRIITAGDTGVAAALNGEIVTRASWNGTGLAEGDEIEVLTAVQGG